MLTIKSISQAETSPIADSIGVVKRQDAPQTVRCEELGAYTGDRSFVMSLARGVLVLQAFAQYSRSMTLIEISRCINIPRTAVRRLLYTLCELGYVQLVGSRYALTSRTLEIGTAFTNSSNFIFRVQPILSQLSSRLNTFCAVAVQQGGHSMLTCVAGSTNVNASRNRIPRPGSKSPLYASASGLVFLSTFSKSELDDYFARTAMLPVTMRTPTTPQQTRELLDDVRTKGHATCDRYLVNSVLSTAVPVHNQDGRIVGALVAGVDIDRMADPSMKTMMVPMLNAAAREVGLNWDCESLR